MWVSHPELALLTTCGTLDPHGQKARTGSESAGSAKAAATGELVGPSDYPSEDALAEMVDPFEALICWFYLPAGGGGNTNTSGIASGGGENRGDDVGGGAVACFVAYHDEGKRHAKAGDNDKTHTTPMTTKSGREENTTTAAELEQQRAAIAARERGQRHRGRGGSPGGGSHSGSAGSSSDGDHASAAGKEEELDATEFEPGVFRVRVVVAGPGTTAQLRKATDSFLSAARNRNPVSDALLSYNGYNRTLIGTSQKRGLPYTWIFRRCPLYSSYIEPICDDLLGMI